MDALVLLRAFAGVVSAVLFVACGRQEPDRSVATAAAVEHTASPAKSAPSASTVVLPPFASLTASRCLFPLSETPPPRATPAASCPKDEKGPMRLARGWVSFPDTDGAPRVAVEVADDSASRERGLMYVTKLPEDQGMIFTWDDEDFRSFWMHDTCIPLDMLYVAADGTIVGVLEQVPAMDETPRSIHCPIKYVLEVNAGWTRAHGITPGQRIKFET
jgi:hypothetical protein